MDKSKQFWAKLGVTFLYHSHMYRIQADEAKKPTGPDDPHTQDTDVFENQDTDVFENQGIYQAPKPTQQLKELANGSKVVDVPEGEPLFLFSHAVGRSRPIKIFYDGGCSHVVI